MKDACICGTSRPFAACCGPLLGGAAAADAEALMRSRYTAYVLRDEAYLLSNWHSATRPSSLALDDGSKWLCLTVRAHRILGPGEATVAFIARYRDAAGKGHRLEELSRFVLEEGRWYYVSALSA